MTPDALKDKEIADLFQRQRVLIEKLAAVQAEMRALGIAPAVSGTWVAGMQNDNARINDRLDGKNPPPAPKPLTESGIFDAMDIRRALQGAKPKVGGLDESAAFSDDLAV